MHIPTTSQQLVKASSKASHLALRSVALSASPAPSPHLAYPGCETRKIPAVKEMCPEQSKEHYNTTYNKAEQNRIEYMIQLNDTEWTCAVMDSIVLLIVSL